MAKAEKTFDAGSKFDDALPPASSRERKVLHGPDIIKSVTEAASRISLAPSMFDRYFNYVFGKYTGENIAGIYRHYIEPLSDDIAKEVLKIVLLYSEIHPELLRGIGEAAAKENFVRIANIISAESGKRELQPFPEFVIQRFREEIVILEGNRHKEAEEKMLAKVREGLFAANEQISQGRTLTPNLKKEFAGLAHDRRELLSGLHYFPGMPRFTYRLYRAGQQFTLVEKKDSPTRTTTDEVVYDVYLGARNLGRFTVRRHGNIVERNLFLTYPNGEIASIGEGGTTMQDLLRQAKEYGEVIFDKIKG